MIIADANVWIDFFKRPNDRMSQALDDLLRERRVALVGIILTELLRGARSERELRVLKNVLDGPDYIEMNRNAWARAGQISMDLDTAGQRIPVTDALIAAVALEGQHEVLTRDKRHFERVPGLRLYDPEGVV
ncbi:MAG TPA: PIN domain-containing protein [Dehalococcoidia bacterium]|jgi:predicted nucleic acid-binding protein|nr:PIN domain-containing protein [Dehalococcoidia bacterium]